MGVYAHCNLPRSATGARGCYQDGAYFGSWQCETYVLARDSGASTPQRRWVHLDLPLGGHPVHHAHRGLSRWVVSLLKLDSGAWVSGETGCWVAGPHYSPHPDRYSALHAAVLAVINQAWRQYRVTGMQRLLVGIEAEELENVTAWAAGLLDRPEPRRVRRAQRRTLLEAAKEG